MKEIIVRSRAREDMLDITREIQDVIAAERWKKGAVLVFCAHTTAAVTINENADANVCRDMLHGLSRISPRLAEFSHDEGNSDAHIKASLVGASEIIPVENGALSLGTWQGVWFCEFDGPRRRRVLVQWLGA